MTETLIRPRNGYPSGWRLTVGGAGFALAISVGALLFNAGGVADDVEENTIGRLQMGVDVQLLKMDRAAAAVTAQATADRLEKIEGMVEQNRDVLQRILVLLGGGSGAFGGGAQ